MITVVIVFLMVVIQMHPLRFSRIVVPALAALLLAAAPSGTAASEANFGRVFTALDQAAPSAPGEAELEQSIAWIDIADDSDDAESFDFDHSLGYGITDLWQITLGLSTSGRIGAGQRCSGRFAGAGLEILRSLADPAESALGATAGLEACLGDDASSIGAKLFLEKISGRWDFVYNLEAATCSGGDDAGDGAVCQGLGASRLISRRVALGFEAKWELPVPDWSRTGRSALYAGPVAAVAGGGWWGTLAPLFRVDGPSDGPEATLTILFGLPL